MTVARLPPNKPMRTSPFRMSRPLLREYVRYFIHHGINATARRQFAPDLIRQAFEFGYVHWPKHLQARVKNRQVLDVGCGMGLHSVGFLLSGVRGYTGCDPRVEFDSDVMKNARLRLREACGWTPRQIMARHPQLRYVRGTLDDLPAGAQWDVAVLHNTTEHLLEIRAVFASLHTRLRKNGLLIFRHHNFYAWNGHHLAPKNVSAIDPADPGQRRVVDWAHLDPGSESLGYLATGLNRIRLDELRELTEEFYLIDKWQESLSNDWEGRLRLSAGILRRHPKFTRRELETQSIFCIARPRS